MPSGTVLRFPKGDLTPSQVGAFLVDNADNISSVLIVTLDKDGNATPTWTKMEMSKLCYVSAIVQQSVMQALDNVWEG